MKEPTILQYMILVVISLFMAVAGLYFLAKFSTLFKRSIRNELLRKNVAAFLIILCISTAMGPMNSGFFYLLMKFGAVKTILAQLGSAVVCTLLGFNAVRWVAEHRLTKKVSFFQHKLITTGAIILVTVAINIPTSYWLYGGNVEYLKYSLTSSIYLGGAIGLVYGVVSYLDLIQQKKFDEKELELSRLRESKAKAELDALHSKVNPHFLYNALNSIADLSITDGKKARKMTIALADLFRYSINYSQNNYSSVLDEVEMTDVYLQIEKIRFEDQLTYTVKIDEGTGHFLLPRFLLQPLVENAVKHGLKATGKLTEIFLEVKRQADTLVIHIADNGPAFPAELMPGYGLKSVFDKLDLLFPNQYEILFTNEPRKQVTIHLHNLLKNEPTT